MEYAPEERSYQINPDSGRPEAPLSWRLETFYHIASVILALLFGVAGLFALFRGPWAFTLLTIVLVTMTLFKVHRGRQSLRRRKDEFAVAEKAYLAAILEPPVDS